MDELQRRVDEYPWRLRAAWATGEPVSVRYEQSKIEVAQAQGWVISVAATGEFALLRLLDDPEGALPFHVPVRALLSVHGIGEHFHEGRGRRPPRRPPPDQGVLEGQLGLVTPPPVSPRAVRLALRGAAEMLPPDVLGVLAAIDRAGARPTLASVASCAGRSERWTSSRVRALEQRGYVRRIRRSRKPDLLMLLS